MKCRYLNLPWDYDISMLDLHVSNSFYDYIDHRADANSMQF